MAEARSTPKKHWVCYVGDELHMKRNAEWWVDAKKNFGKNYELLDTLKDKDNFLSVVNPNDILYIHCHGYRTETLLCVRDFEGYKSKENNCKLDEIAYNPAQFLEFLKSHGLNPEHKILKIAACYSSVFAKELYLLAVEAFPSIIIHGYSNQLVLCQGLKSGKLAGLEPPFVVEENNGSWRLNNHVTENIANFEEKFKAKLHSSVFPRDLILANALNNSMNVPIVNNFNEAPQIRRSPRKPPQSINTASRRISLMTVNRSGIVANEPLNKLENLVNSIRQDSRGSNLLANKKISRKEGNSEQGFDQSDSNDIIPKRRNSI